MIRFFTRSIGESRTKVNHVGIVVEGGSLKTAVVVEALVKVRRHRLWEEYGPPSRDEVAVYRAKHLTDEEIDTIVSAANAYVGRKYGFWMLAAHLADWMLLGSFAFRRVLGKDKYPICSWLVAHSFAKAGKHFGTHPGAATPDDIWDFIVVDHPELYDVIHPLKPLA
jgi:hypothetical protein